VQLFISLGLVIGYFTCYGTVKIASSLSWRLPLALQSVISLFLALAAFFYLPQSPRWLSYKGRKEEANAAWDVLGVSAAEREKDLIEVSAPGSLVAEETPERAPEAPLRAGLRQRMGKNVQDLTSVFKSGPRKPMLMGVFVMAMQQLSGIDGVIYVCLRFRPFSYIRLTNTLHSMHHSFSNKPDFLHHLLLSSLPESPPSPSSSSPFFPSTFLIVGAAGAQHCTVEYFCFPAWS
jgi:hypothetical protein